MKFFHRYLAGLALILGLLLFLCLRSLPDGMLHVFVLDVGQGDAILIETPAQEYVLIDGGPDEKVIQRLSEILPFYEKTIDVVILTHPHADHVNGLVEVLRRYKVREILFTGVAYHYAGYEALLQLIDEKKIPVFFASGEQDYRLGSVTLDILFPFHSIQNESFDNLNNSSLVFRLLYGEKKIYFTGDLEMEMEKELVASGLDLHADFLKIGHHGSKTSSTEAFLDRVQPDYAIISCGVDNKFGHPYAETLSHLQQRKIRVYRTDVDGTVEVVSDGEELSVRGSTGSP